MPLDLDRIGRIVGLTPDEILAQKRRLFTAGNAISILRVVLLPFLLWTISLPRERGLVPMVVIATVVALTDTLDGLVARRMNQVSEMGKIVDPVADKICIGLTAVWLHIYRGLPLWIPLIIIGRDVVIVAGSVLLIRKADLVMPSHQLGRITTFVLAVTLFIFAIDWRWPQEVLVYVSGVFVFATFYLYVRIGWVITRKL